MTATLIEHINNSNCRIISIDIPSGLSADQSSKGNRAIKATDTLSFQCYKAAFLVSENSLYTGKVHILDIGLHPQYYNLIATSFELIDANVIRSLYKPRNRFAHKGDFGHVLLIAGSYGKIGAAVYRPPHALEPVPVCLPAIFPHADIPSCKHLCRKRW